jgi:hypothetical protein
MACALVLAITWAGTRGFIDRWSVAEWLVAAGTLGLAWATFRLTRRVSRQVKVEREQLVASTRPLVLPIQGDNFDREIYVADVEDLSEAANQPSGPHVLLENAGAGPALNVRGSLYWSGSAGGASALHPLVLPPSDQKWAKVLGEGAVVNWANAVGYLRYHDLSGTEWQTHFRFRRDGEGNISVAILAAGETGEFGEPGYNGEEGWTNPPADLVLWQP